MLSTNKVNIHFNLTLNSAPTETQQISQDNDTLSINSNPEKAELETENDAEIVKDKNPKEAESNEYQSEIGAHEEKMTEDDPIDTSNNDVNHLTQTEGVIADDIPDSAGLMSKNNMIVNNNKIQPISAIGEEERDAIVKQLSGKYLESESNSPLTQIMSPNMEINEKESVQKFLSCLMEILPHILRLDSLTDVDTMLQQFSSSICSILNSPKGKQQHSFPNQTVRDDDDENSSLCSEKRATKRQSNDLSPSYADNIYLATYSVLALCWKLDMSGYYRSRKLNQEKTPIVSEVQCLLLINDILIWYFVGKK